MALTLPYPNMDFTPLDILTADEMDQLVANIEFISQQFPIAPANLDFTDLTAKQKTLWSGSVTDTTTWVSLNETVKNACLYTATFAAISSSYVCTFPFYGGSREHQFYHSDGSNYVRWRLELNNTYTQARLASITTNTTNMNYIALKDIKRVVLGNFAA